MEGEGGREREKEREREREREWGRQPPRSYQSKANFVSQSTTYKANSDSQGKQVRWREGGVRRIAGVREGRGCKKGKGV